MLISPIYPAKPLTSLWVIFEKIEKHPFQPPTNVYILARSYHFNLYFYIPKYLAPTLSHPKVSSLKSPQLLIPSQNHLLSIYVPLLHRNAQEYEFDDVSHKTWIIFSNKFHRVIKQFIAYTFSYYLGNYPQKHQTDNSSHFWFEKIFVTNIDFTLQTKVERKTDSRI